MPTTIFLLIFAIHGVPDHEMRFAFHKKAECESLAFEISKVPGNQVLGWECKELLLSSK